MEHFNLDSLGFKDYSVTKCGKVYSHLSNKYLKPSVVRGYLRVGLMNKSLGKSSCHYIHTLVRHYVAPAQSQSNKKADIPPLPC